MSKPKKQIFSQVDLGDQDESPKFVLPTNVQERLIALGQRKFLTEQDKQIAHLTAALVSTDTHGCVIYGDGGLGKTFDVVETLKILGIEYHYMSGAATPMSVYSTLYNHRDALIVLDDLEGALQEKVANFLKAALWTAKDDKRTITYETPSPFLTIPRSFEFKGKVLIILNEVKKEDDPHLQALLTRCNYARVNYTYEEKLAKMEMIAKLPYKNLTEDERLEVYKFIRDNSTPAIKGLSFRTLMRGFELYEYSKLAQNTMWKELIFATVNEDDTVKTIYELSQGDLPVEEQARRFYCTTGKSRSTFFRERRKLGRYVNLDDNEKKRILELPAIQEKKK